jgi:hypothetical protein
LIVVTGVWLTGCQNGKPNPAPHDAGASSGPHFVQSEPQIEAVAADPVPLSDDSTAQSAQAAVAEMPAVSDPRVQQEILLHAALYRAAIQASVGSTGRFVLEPAHDSAPPLLGVNPSEFRLRVLASLADLHLPIAWAPPNWRDQQVDYFPETQDKATRITVMISNRDQNNATVSGEFGDRTWQDRNSRQAFTATWDGVQWNVQRDRTRVVW